MEKEEKTKEKGSDMTVYEVSYLLLPSLALEQVPAVVGEIKNSINTAGGEVVSGEDPILIDLAYTMTKIVQTQRYKCDSGYFGWTKFELTADGMEAVKKALDANDNILRYLLVKTVKENTLLQGKMMLKKEDVKREYSEETIEDSDEVSESEPESDKVSEEGDIDKSIDDLVIN